MPISFSSADYLQFPPPGFSLRWYAPISATRPGWRDLRSLHIAGVDDAAATVLGTLLAFSIVRGRYPGRALVIQVATAPLVVPTIVYSVAVYGLFADLRLIGKWQGIALAPHGPRAAVRRG